MLHSITIKSSKGKRTYVSDLDYDVYKGNITQHLEYYFTLKPVWETVSTRSKPNYSPQSWIYLDYALIKKYTSDIKSLSQLPPRITNNSPEMSYKLLNDSVNKQWELLSHSAYFIDNDTILCDNHKYNFKYFIPIFDDSVTTIFDFTNNHINLLDDIKESVTNWINDKWNTCVYDEKMKEKIRFYTLFPNKDYLYPFFIVDYYDETNISYTRIVDKTRMILIDDIKEILEKNNNMKKYFVKYYTSRDSSLFILAQNEIKKSLQLFFDICRDMLIQSEDSGSMMKNSFAVQGEIEDIKELEDENIEAKIKQILEEKLEQNGQYTETTHEFNIAEYMGVLDNVENYKYLHYFWKCLLDNDNYYSFVSQWNTLLKEPIERKQQNPHNKFKNRKNRKIEGTEKNEGDMEGKNLRDYKVNMVYFDGTRGTSPFRTIVGLVCQKDEEFYQINIITDKLFKNNKIANDTEFPLIGKIKNKLVNNGGDVILREGIDNYYYGKGVNNESIPCIIEIHKLPGNLDFIYNNQNNLPLYTDYAYAYISAFHDRDIIKETVPYINLKLQKMNDVSIDGKKLNMFAFILYCFTDRKILKKIIRKHVLSDIPENFIWHNSTNFICIPDKSLEYSYANSTDKKNFKITINNLEIIVWHVDKNIYNKALDSDEIYKDGKTIKQIIDNLQEDDIYPFREGKITKYINDTQPYPHLFKYMSIKLLDDLYIFINQYFNYVKTEYKININDTVMLNYFHNTTYLQSILHLHIRTKAKKYKLRHIYQGLLLDDELRQVYYMDDVMRSFLNKIDYTAKLLYTVKDNDILAELERKYR
jgi:hypothetical protein